MFWCILEGFEVEVKKEETCQDGFPETSCAQNEKKKNPFDDDDSDGDVIEGT